MLRRSRDKALFLAYQKALRDNDFSNQREAVDFVRKSEAPRWFVSKEFCAAVISCWLRGKDFCKMRANKRRKFSALFEIYKDMRQRLPYSSLSHLDLCGVIVDLPAPEWFLDWRMASRIIAEQMEIKNELIASVYGRK